MVRWSAFNSRISSIASAEQGILVTRNLREASNIRSSTLDRVTAYDALLIEFINEI